eukprot:CAMPEP_0179129262 /NCGR_PEP_ID=MMETSP0796-20121207/61323_1 /TAXON_ID=73915 /ORGANISM="Pyrodinium bahamense, Strain pbaha01" /LENGTH=202 /DNA_ID=CAMNT_0020828135 /DNA_START=74 /DNA_END=683 /DNA_ORIENTATION=+
MADQHRCQLVGLASPPPLGGFEYLRMQVFRRGARRPHRQPQASARAGTAPARAIRGGPAAAAPNRSIATVGGPQLQGPLRKHTRGLLPSSEKALAPPGACGACCGRWHQRVPRHRPQSQQLLGEATAAAEGGLATLAVIRGRSAVQDLPPLHGACAEAVAGHRAPGIRVLGIEVPHRRSNTDLVELVHEPVCQAVVVEGVLA